MPLEHRHHVRCGCAAGASAERASGRPFTLPSSVRHFERDLPFAIDHLAVELTLDLPARSIRATARLRVRRIDAAADELALDAIGFALDDVAVDGAIVRVRYDGTTLVVPWSGDRDAAVVTVVYRATPRRGLYFLEPDEHVPTRPRQVWSQCQEEDARHWIPCHDSPHLKMAIELTAHVPNGWFALSNGALVSSDRPTSGDWTYRWAMPQPIPSYLMTLAAGEFACVEEEAALDGATVPLAYYVPKGREGDVPRTFGRTREMVRYFSEVTGVAYPWNKYAQIVVADFIFGGMENTTATTLYEHVLLDARAALDVSSDDLVAHELAHHWFGDYVTCRAWYEGWLNEGFATYFEHVWREKHLGRDEYAFGVKADLDAYLAEAHGRYRRPIVCQDYDAPLDLFDRHLYEKAGLVLHALRVELGDERFWKGIRRYLEAHANGVVETRDLQRAMEAVSGRSLGRFFEQWLYKAGHPELEVELGWDRGVLSVAVKQTQSTADGVPAAFEFTLELLVVEADGQAVPRRLRVSDKSHAFALPAPVRPAFVVVDPELRVIAEVRLRTPADMLREQLVRAPSARGRWLAAQALARVGDTPSIEALGQVLANDSEFWGTRAECAAALAKIRAREAFAVLSAARGTAHPKVRRAVVDALGAFRTVEAFEAIKPYALRDESYLVEAEAARALGRTRQAAAFEILVDLLDRPSWSDVVRAGAIDGLAALRDDRALSHLTARTRYGHPARARRAAILSLPKLASDRKTRELLEQLLEDADPIVRIDVVRAIGEIADPKARPVLRDRLDLELDPRVRRRIRETMRELAEPRRTTDPLREELDRLQSEHAELKLRLAQVEARVGGAPVGVDGQAGAASVERAGGGSDRATAAARSKGAKRAKNKSRERGAVRERRREGRRR